MPVTLTVHDSQYPAQLTEQLRQGLRTRRLPGKFLYDSPAQAQRWLAYHHAYSPSRTDPRLLAFYEETYQAALQTLRGSALHYISLGCGGGNKDALLLQQAVPRYASVVFTPTDTSTALVLETMLRVEHAFPDLQSAPLVVDLDAEPDLLSWLSQQETGAYRRLFTCFGMIPNFVYGPFVRYLRSLMRPGDRLLLSANLSPVGAYADAVTRILPQYDNPHAHAWFAGLLDSLGFAASQVRLLVQAQPLRPDGRIWQIQTTARVLEPLTLSLYGEPFAFDPGTVLRLFFSNRFTPEVMPQVLAEAGLTVMQTWLFDSQEEGIYLCAV